MTTGDLAYFTDLIANKQLPQGWFPEDATVLSALVQGIAAGSAFNFDQLRYVNAQTRIQTMTDRNLDMFALEFFGPNRLYRHQGEEDDHYRVRLIRALVLEKGTRKGMIDALTAVSGIPPLILEPANPLDCGGYDLGGCAYDIAGAWGTLDEPYQVFITAFQAPGPRTPGAAGYGELDNENMPGGYDVGSVEYANDDFANIQNLNSEILDTITDVKPAGVLAWVNILPAPATS